MPADWIKMRTDLYRDPKVISIAALLAEKMEGVTSPVTVPLLRNAVVGCLVAVWGVMRHQGCNDGDDLVVKNTPLRVLDSIADMSLFGEAMSSVGWVIQDGPSLRFPRFFSDKNADPRDRERTSNAERQRRFRNSGGGNPKKWTALRIRILKRDNHVCAYCGEYADTVDHIDPKQGGDEINLVACCRICNRRKNNRTPEEAGMVLRDVALQRNASNAQSREEKSREEEDTFLHFDTFWLAYPRKVNKADAKKAWRALKPQPDLVATLMTALRKQTPLWTELRFIPYPSKWLNGKRWEDEISDLKPIKPANDTSGIQEGIELIKAMQGQS